MRHWKRGLVEATGAVSLDFWRPGVVLGSEKLNISEVARGEQDDIIKERLRRW